MSLGIGSLGPSYPAPDAVQRSRFVPSTPAEPLAAQRGADRVELTVGTPPPEVRAQVDAAYQRAIELATQNRELHFSRDEDSGRIVVQVRDLEGHLIRTIPNKDAFDILSGAEL